LLRNSTVLVGLLLSVVGIVNGQTRIGPDPRNREPHAADILANDSNSSTFRSRPATVVDSIEMTRVAGDTHYDSAPPYPPLAYFSPDGSRFIVVLRKGNLQHNTNDYSMVMFETARAFDSPLPEMLAVMSSTSNRDAIQLVRWLDNETITFLGENPNENPQVFGLSLKTRRLEQLTAHATPVLNYRIQRDTGEVIFTAETAGVRSESSQDARRGIPINDEMLRDIVAGNVGDLRQDHCVYSVKRGGPEKRLPEKDIPGVETKSESNDTIRVTREQDLNTPERLYITEPKTKRKSLLLDLNPQFASLRFASAENISWPVKNGGNARGALYLPIGYLPGKKYPLVIQTHYFNTDHFLIDGPWGSGYALQALVGRDFIVVQVGELLPEELFDKLVNTADEAPYAMATYEGLIDYLDVRGLIQRNRVGIFAFSRTVYYVAYTLTHSKYRFAAAILEDGVDGGYLQYLNYPNLAKGYDEIYRGRPFGGASPLWATAPGFNLDKVESPVRIMEHGYAGALVQWEWFSGLRLLHKPVDMVILPNPPSEEQHLLKKPWEMLVSQQGTIDWFCYWLKDEEDEDPVKFGQYERWRQLKKQYASSEGASPGIPAMAANHQI
jgi:hypothetical protein